MPQDLGKLLGRLLILCAGGALASLVAWLASPFYDTQRGYQDAVFRAASGAPRVLVVGDSHAVASLPPGDLADDVHNLAWGADGPLEMLVKLRWVLPRAPTVQAVIVSVDVQMFSRRRGRSSNRSFLSAFLWRLRDPGLARRSWPTLAIETLPAASPDFILFTRQQLERVLSPRRRLADRLRDDERLWSSLGADERAQLGMQRGWSDHFGVLDAPSLEEDFRRIERLCREGGVRVVGVRFPVTADYRAAIRTEDRARVDALVRSLAFDRLLDYSGAFHDPALFRDPDHLNREGARAFLRLLQAETGLRLVAR